MRALMFLIILIACSCSKSALLSRDAMGLHINGIGMEITRVDVYSWNVGKKKEAKISQSFIIIVDTPKLKSKDLDYLTEQKGINSWIVRLIHQKGSERVDMGSVFVPFRTYRKGRGGVGSQASSVVLKVFYAAAYASERFRAFNCPAFNHNRKITSIKIAGEPTIMNMTMGSITSFKEKAQQMELTPNAFNGGHSLEGEYYVEFAPYDSVKKLLHSSFMRIPQYVEVGLEEKQVIESCYGENPELQPRQ